MEYTIFPPPKLKSDRVPNASSVLLVSPPPQIPVQSDSLGQPCCILLQAISLNGQTTTNTAAATSQTTCQKGWDPCRAYPARPVSTLFLRIHSLASLKDLHCHSSQSSPAALGNLIIFRTMANCRESNFLSCALVGVRTSSPHDKHLCTVAINKL